MSITLSGRTLARLAAASATLLSPFDYERVGEWRAASRHVLADLLGADISGSVLALPGEPLLETEPESRPGAAAYEAYYHRLDTGLSVTRRQKGLEVFSVHDIYDWAEYKKTEIFADWNVPHRLYDSVALASDMGPHVPAATMHFYHQREQGPRFDERALALLRLVLPSFKAGVQMLVHFGAARDALAAALDRSGEALALFDATGRLLHETPAVATLLGPEPGRAQPMQSVRRLARSLAEVRDGAPHRTPRVPDPWTTLSTVHGPVRAVASVLGADLVGPGVRILVTLERAGPARVDDAGRVPAPLPDAALRERFRLTTREVAVARLLARRRSTAEIAGALGISPHTARRHTEHVYDKLAAHNRADVGARVGLD